MCAQTLIPIYSVNFDYIVNSRDRTKTLFAYTNAPPLKKDLVGKKVNLISSKHNLSLPPLRVEDVEGTKIVLSFFNTYADYKIQNDISKIGQDIQNFPVHFFYPYSSAGSQFHPYHYIPKQTSYGFSSRDDNFFKTERGWVFNEDPFGMSKPLMYLVF
jgi:hypothetical protein